MKLRIKYFEGATKLKKIAQGNWIDIYSRKDVFIPEGKMRKVPLGFALGLPKGFEGWVAPRSSTFTTWGCIQVNSPGVIDDLYIGDNDEWCTPLFCLNPKNIQDGQSGTLVKKGDKIGQFRIIESMEEIELEETDYLGNVDRGGFGTTGRV